eukprot:2506628-Pyramimonas_sp.AAC.1
MVGSRGYGLANDLVRFGLDAALERDACWRAPLRVDDPWPLRVAVRQWSKLEFALKLDLAGALEGATQSTWQRWRL